MFLIPAISLVIHASKVALAIHTAKAAVRIARKCGGR